MFALDRDMLAIEPHAFTDALYAGLRLSTGTATVVGTTLTATSVSVGFIDAQAQPGQVVVFNGVPLEVVGVVSPTVLEVSRLRASVDDTPSPPTPGVNVSFTLVSFSPQIRIVHGQVMGLLGLDRVDGPGPEAVVDASALAHVESLGALHLVYAAASVLSGPSSALGARAAMYADMFSRARQTLSVGLDLNGDGEVDATRRASIVHLVRG